MNGDPIPFHDLGDFGSFGDDCKAEVLTLARAMQAVDAASKKVDTLRAQANRLGRSFGRLKALYYGTWYKGKDGARIWRDGWKSAGWRALVDRAKYCPVSRELSGSFLDYWKELRMQYQRDQTGKAAHDELCARLRRWERDPQCEELRMAGYDAPPKRDPYTQLPPGWTYSNLINHRAAAPELAAMKRGRGAALSFRAPVLLTRAGLRVGQYLQFDDQEYDEFVNFLGVNRQLQRVLGLDCIDVASASYPAHAFLPVTYDEAKQQRKKLKAFHAEWFVAHVFMTFGYRPDTGTTGTIEHGTMTVSEEFQERMERATGGKVSFLTSKIIDNKAYAGMFDGKGGGNFKMKGLLEGARVAHRNRASLLPAPTGLDPDHAREEAYAGLQKVNHRVLKLMERLPPERAGMLAHVALEFHTFVRIALEIYELLETDQEHELEGWNAQEWVLTEWRHSLESGDWHRMEELALIENPTVREAMRTIVTSQPGMFRTRQFSRREARATQQHELAQVRGAAVPILLGREAARIGRVGTQHPLIKVEADENFPEPLWFMAQTRERKQMLERGQEYLLYVDPFGSRRAEVCDLENRWLGGVELWDRASPMDVEAIGEKFGIAEAVFKAEIQANVPRWALPTTEARTAIFEHNVAVARGEIKTQEDRAMEQIDVVAETLKRPKREQHDAAAAWL